jgi:hypothetical protein
MPSRTTVFRWLADPGNQVFRDQYAYAREEQADAYFDEMIELADTSIVGEKTELDKDGVVVKTTTGDMIERSRLGIETRKWVLGRMKPKKYGERIDLNHGGQKDNPIMALLAEVSGSTMVPQDDE